MASAGGQVTVRGRFKVGSLVRLVKADSGSVLHAGSSESVATTTVVDEDGVAVVRFDEDVEVGGYYFLCGYVDGHPLNLRARGRKPGEDDSQLAQPPLEPEWQTLANGGRRNPVGDDHPHERHPAPAQHHVADDVPQASRTELGEAVPVDRAAQPPYGRQEDTPEGMVQRSNTPHGVTAPIPGQTSIEDALATVANPDALLGELEVGKPELVAPQDQSQEPAGKGPAAPAAGDVAPDGSVDGGQAGSVAAPSSRRSRARAAVKKAAPKRQKSAAPRASRSNASKEKK